MSIEFTVALIAFAGVLMSTVIAYFTSIRQSKIEAARFQRQIHNEFSEKIFDKRLELYPSLFAKLSNFQKIHIDSKQLSKQDFQDFLSQLYELDSQIAILFSKKTGLVAYNFRVMIVDLASKSDNELSTLYTSEDKRKELRHKFNEYELALKIELGIYAFDDPINIGEFATYQRYGEIADSLQN